jgi:DNA repair exonuclease SbcCD ATPase subunit
LQHAAQVDALKQDFAQQTANLRATLESEAATSARDSLAQAQKTMVAEFDQKLAEAANEYEAQVAELTRQHTNRVAGVQTMLRAAESARSAAETQLAEARASLEELDSRPAEAGQATPSEIAPEVDALLFPDGQAARDESQTADLVKMREALGEANGQIEFLQIQLSKATGSSAGLRAQLEEATAVRSRLDGDVQRLSQELRAIKDRPVDPTAAAMKAARGEAHAAVRLVADANPRIMLVEAAELVGAALTGRTETAFQLPSPVLVDSAA